MDRTSIDIAQLKIILNRRERKRRARGSVKRRWNCDSYIYETLLDKEWRKRNTEGSLRVSKNGWPCCYSESFVKRLREELDKNPSITYRSLAHKFRIGRTSVSRVLGSRARRRDK